MLQGGNLPGKDIVCPVSKESYVVTNTEDDVVVKAPKPGLYGFKEMRVRLSAQLSEQQPGSIKNYQMVFREKKQELGSVISLELPLQQPQERPFKYRGQTFILIGRKSASSSI